MQTLVATAPGVLDWITVPEPSLGSSTAALVRPRAVTTCDFDGLIRTGRAPVPFPLEIGHEMVGEVVDVGDDVDGVAPGDLVVVPFQISCGGCASCSKGRTSSCSEVPWLSCYGLGPGAGDWGAAMADLVAVPYADAMLVPLPEGIPPEIGAAAACNITDAFRCVVPQLRTEPGAPVLVVTEGFQNIALTCVVLARALGSEQVDVLGLEPSAAAKAEKIGARIVGSASDVEPASYPITVDGSLNNELLVTALRATSPGGTCTVSAMYPEELTPVPLLELFASCATIRTGQPHVRGLLDDVLEVLADDKVRSDLLIDGAHSWDDAVEAFASPGKHVITR